MSHSLQTLYIVYNTVTRNFHVVCLAVPVDRRGSASEHFTAAGSDSLPRIVLVPPVSTAGPAILPVAAKGHIQLQFSTIMTEPAIV